MKMQEVRETVEPSAWDHSHLQFDENGMVVLGADDRAAMQSLNLDDAYERDEAGAAEFRGFICKGCGLIYGSIQDRMLRDNCHGCVQKVKFG
jgi:hypothetical protein